MPSRRRLEWLSERLSRHPSRTGCGKPLSIGRCGVSRSLIPVPGTPRCAWLLTRAWKCARLPSGHCSRASHCGMWLEEVRGPIPRWVACRRAIDWSAHVRLPCLRWARQRLPCWRAIDWSAHVRLPVGVPLIGAPTCGCLLACH